MRCRQDLLLFPHHASLANQTPQQPPAPRGRLLFCATLLVGEWPGWDSNPHAFWAQPSKSCMAASYITGPLALVYGPRSCRRRRAAALASAGTFLTMRERLLLGRAGGGAIVDTVALWK